MCGIGAWCANPGVRFSRYVAAVFGLIFANGDPNAPRHQRTTEEEQMQLSEVMTRNVETIRPDATLQEAAEKMKSLDVGVLPVADGQLKGILTDRDIVVRCIAEGREARSCKVSEVMSRDVATCHEDQDVQEAAKLMQEKQIRRIVVLNRDDKIVGIISLGDLATDIGNKNLSRKVLEKVSEPSGPIRKVA